MWTRSNKNGKFQVKVWNVVNELTYQGEFDSAQEADRVGEIENRKALAPIIGGYVMTEADWNDPLLDMSDEELLAELSA